MTAKRYKLQMAISALLAVVAAVWIGAAMSTGASAATAWKLMVSGIAWHLIARVLAWWDRG